MRLGRGRRLPMKVKDLILNLRIDVHSLYTGYTRLPEKPEIPVFRDARLD